MLIDRIQESVVALRDARTHAVVQLQQYRTRLGVDRQHRVISPGFTIPHHKHAQIVGFETEFSQQKMRDDVEALCDRQSLSFLPSLAPMTGYAAGDGVSRILRTI